MCIGIPMQVTRLYGDGTTLERAECLPWGVMPGQATAMVDIALVGEVAVGQWLLVFLGAARECLTPQRAEQVGLALRALQQAELGELDGFDELFADLDREPQLPPHLQAQLKNNSKENA